MRKPERIFIGLTEVAGRNRALKWGFEELGHRVTFVNLSRHPFMDSERAPWIVYLLRSIAEGRRRLSLKYPVLSSVSLIFEIPLRVGLLAWLLFTHDVFIYSFGNTLFAYWDYWLARLFGKKIICQFHGSDSRPPYLDGAYVSLPGFTIEKCIRETRKKKRRIQTMDRLAHVVIDIPPQGYFHERNYFLRTLVGLPSGPFPPAEEPPERKEVRILHAPSDAAYKGTERVREAVSKLKAKGLAIDYREITGKKNIEVLRELRDCDLVVDQLYADYAMPGLPSEACWFARPVINAGHSVGLWRHLLPSELTPPIVYCKPEEFEAELERLVRDSEYRLGLGRKAREYVERYHHPKRVAENYLRLAQGKPYPIEWLYDPRSLREVVGGFFMPELKAKAIVRQMVEKGGVESLQLQDKPELERKIVEWAATLQ